MFSCAVTTWCRQKMAFKVDAYEFSNMKDDLATLKKKRGNLTFGLLALLFLVVTIVAAYYDFSAKKAIRQGIKVEYFIVESNKISGKGKNARNDGFVQWYKLQYCDFQSRIQIT